ncbi:hypothetical protein FRC12_022915 [Ceratobasidium sp. 428]|nr:hypothetical protein FRC12_022915 [Ceratobasidium sp. 428]
MDIPATSLPSGRFKFMFRSILRDQTTPRAGPSVRWGAHDTFRTITPNTSANSTEGAQTFDAPSRPLLEAEEQAPFLDRLQSDSSEHSPTDGKGNDMLDELAALG